MRKMVLFAAAICGLGFAGQIRATTFLVEAEELERPGGWNVAGDSGAVHKFLVAGADARKAPAAGAIDVPHAGKWRLWVRSKDFPDYLAGVRTFSVRLGDKTSLKSFGKHGNREFDGWAWEDGGALDLKAGPTLVVLGEELTSSARCDALLLTDSTTYKPEGPPWTLHKSAAKKVPLTTTVESLRAYLPEPLREISDKPVALLQNESLRISFHEAKTAAGSAMAMRAAVLDGGEWKKLSDDSNCEGYRVLFRPATSDPKMTKGSVRPTWDASLSPLVEFRAGDAMVKTRIGPGTAPWQSGLCFPARPTEAKQVDARTVALSFAPLSNGVLSATWRLATNRPDVEIALSFKPATPGHFSLGYHGPLASLPEDTDFMLLPFLFHGHRFPEQPVAIPSAITPTPMSLVARDGISCAVVAEPSDIAFDWPGASNSLFALALRNETGLAQPMIYSPVLGQPGSKIAGSSVDARFHLWIERGDWFAAYRHIASEVFQLRDYRQPATASLSDAALNLFDLMKNEKAAGWDAKAKGPWNIESRNVVTHSSPLFYLSLYLLTGDEDFYRRFTLPTLEYLISRPGPHFGAEREIGDNYYRHQQMIGPGKMNGASVFASAFAMTHGRTAAFGEFCLDEKGARPTRGGHVQPFEDSLALFRLTGERQWLDAAVAGADKYIAENFTKLPARDVGDLPFVNVSFIPDWEGLLRIYEVTGERRFLDAAQEGARWLMTTLWTQPQIPNGRTTVNPGGQYDHARHVWWMGDRLFRLGLIDAPATTNRVTIPPIALPEHSVPAWQVSNVGLGLEQPCTYTRRGTHANISMSIWAANFLRLAGATGDDLFRTAARNATIGRFANYPGYYIDGPTDQYQRPDYPVTGPDVTTLYVHHIPPFAAYVFDYLFTDAEMRSAGEITFPATRQCGYVWFDSRLFGHAPGKIYGQPAWPWLHRTAATVNTIHVDHLLAHGDGRFHVILMNQIREPQQVRVTFDEKVLGRSIDGARISLRSDGKVCETLAVKGRSVSLLLSPSGFAVLSVDGVDIDVPTHRVAPPENFSLPERPAVTHVKLDGSQVEAVGALIEVPPFTWRDLYVYIAAGIDDCRTAKLRYRVGNAPEQEISCGRFPWEFSARIADMKSPVEWSVDVQLADGSWKHGTSNVSN